MGGIVPPNALLRFFLVALLALAACDDPAAPERVAAVKITARTTSLVPRDTVTLVAVATATDGKPLANVALTWRSSDSTVATVLNGVVTAVAPGSALITASAGSASDTLRVRVEAPLPYLSMIPGSVMLVPGDTARLTPFTLLLTPGGGLAPLTGREVRYTSGQPSVATVSDSGVVRAVAPGTATVTVAVGERMLSVPVVVTRPYTLTYLGTLGGPASQANAVNASGQVVGRAQAADSRWRAFLWENGRMRDLGSLGHPYMEAVAINDRGTVVGNAGENGFFDCGPGGCGAKQPWKWEAGALTPITVAGAQGSVLLTDVNNQGQVTGYTYEGYYRFATGEGFVWKDGAVTWIGKTGSGYDGGIQKRSAAVAINDDGAVAATMTYYATDQQAYVWRSGQFTALRPGGVLYTSAGDINASGEVAGGFYDASVYARTGVFSSGGRKAELSPSYSYGEIARGINASGHVVGTSAPAGGGTGSYGFLWRDGAVGDLNRLVPGSDWIVRGATGINNRGWIVGYGKNRTTGATGAILLTPPQ